MSQRIRLIVQALENREVPALFTVMNLLDSGAGSLRQAILDANTLAGADTIDFAVQGTITLTTGELSITQDLTINGPGANLLQISGNNASRVMNSGFSVVTVFDLTISNGTASVGGGYIGLGQASFTRCNFSGNNAQYGGGISSGDGFQAITTLTLNDCVLTGNTATQRGGGAWIQDSVMVKNCTFINNKCKNGGGIYLEYTGTIDSCTISSNTATMSGGGILSYGAFGAITVLNSRINNNTSSGDGGGVYGTFNAPQLINCTITGNIAGGDGGGIAANSIIPNAQLRVANSTIANNSAAGNGGGLATRATADSFPLVIAVSNSTISGNTAGGDGGGLHVSPTSATYQNFRIRNSTVTSNIASGKGGGIVGLAGFPLTLASTIVAKNSAPNAADVYRDAKLALSTCLVSDIGGIGTTTGLVSMGVDPLLAPLANNGGATLTHALLPGSPAINKGSNPSFLSTDQRGIGYSRDINGVDIGAFETQSPRVGSVLIGDGTAQRSRVTSLAVTFNSPVTLPANPATAFELKRQSDGAQVTLDGTTVGNTVTLIFAGGPIDFGSLADGRYTLTVIASQVSNAYDQLDGDGDGSGGDNYVLIGTPANGLFRIYGDADGDGAVATSDFIQFRLAFGGTSAVFDFDGDGSVSASDFIEFRLRFGGSV